MGSFAILIVLYLKKIISQNSSLKSNSYRNTSDGVCFTSTFRSLTVRINTPCNSTKTNATVLTRILIGLASRDRRRVVIVKSVSDDSESVSGAILRNQETKSRGIADLTEKLRSDTAMPLKLKREILNRLRLWSINKIKPLFKLLLHSFLTLYATLSVLLVVGINTRLLGVFPL